MGTLKTVITEEKSGEEPTKAAWARCPNCGHCWPAAYYPMKLETFAKVMQKHCDCPKCNTPGVIAKQEDGVLNETACPLRDPLPDST